MFSDSASRGRGDTHTHNFSLGKETKILGYNTTTLADTGGSAKSKQDDKPWVLPSMALIGVAVLVQNQNPTSIDLLERKAAAHTAPEPPTPGVSPCGWLDGWVVSTAWPSRRVRVPSNQGSIRARAEGDGHWGRSPSGPSTRSQDKGSKAIDRFERPRRKRSAPKSHRLLRQLLLVTAQAPGANRRAGAASRSMTGEPAAPPLALGELQNGLPLCSCFLLPLAALHAGSMRAVDRALPPWWIQRAWTHTGGRLQRYPSPLIIQAEEAPSCSCPCLSRRARSFLSPLWPCGPSASRLSPFTREGAARARVGLQCARTTHASRPLL